MRTLTVQRRGLQATWKLQDEPCASLPPIGAISWIICFLIIPGSIPRRNMKRTGLILYLFTVLAAEKKWKAELTGQIQTD